jgi:TonB family protein
MSTSQKRDGRDDGLNFKRGNGQLPDAPGGGIPTLVFKEALPAGERPTADKKALEVVLMWGDTVLSIAHYGTARPVSIGDDPANDFRVSSSLIATPTFRLLDAVNGQFVINFTSAMSLEVRNEAGDVFDRDALEKKNLLKSGGSAAHSYAIGLHDRVAVQLDKLTFVMQYVSPATVLTTPLGKSIDYFFTKILGFAFLAHMFILIALLITPYDPIGSEEDLFTNPNRFAQLLLKEPEKKKEKKKFELSGKKGGGKHKDKEGKFGKVEAKQKDALASAKGAPRVDPNKREKDRKVALNSGLFQALKGQSGNVSDVFGPGGLGSGINQALGGLRGANMGDAAGGHGLGSRGTGPGGGGNSLGIGGLGDGTGYGTGGTGDIDLGGRGKGQYKVEVGRTITKGCLTSEVVMRVLSRVQSQAKYCYEKELPRNPNLQGKVTTTFVIGPTGSVQTTSISESTMGNASVESCLERVVQRLKFPPCEGGGVAEVTYPWIFSTGGAQ